MTYHSHSVGGQDLCWGEDSKVGHIGQQVDHSNQGQRDVDGSRQILVRLLQLLGHKVQVVPARVGEQPRVEGESQMPRGKVTVFHGVLHQNQNIEEEYIFKVANLVTLYLLSN